MSTHASLEDAYRVRLAEAECIADRIVTLLPLNYAPRSSAQEFPPGWQDLLDVLDPDNNEERYALLLDAILITPSEELPKLCWDLDECVGARLALWGNARDIFYRALARRQAKAV